LQEVLINTSQAPPTPALKIQGYSSILNPPMDNTRSKADRIRYLLTMREYRTSEVASLVGCSGRWVRKCRAKLHGSVSLRARDHAAMLTLEGEFRRLEERVERLEMQVSIMPTGKY
jgi:hypothetical protein